MNVDYEQHQRAYRFHLLAKSIGSLIAWATNPDGALTDAWLDKTRDSLNAAVTNAQSSIGLTNQLRNKLTTTRTLGLHLARLLWESSRDGNTALKDAVIGRTVKDLIELESEFRRLGDGTTQSTIAVKDVQPVKPAATTAELSGEAKAVALLVEHPEWSNIKIAKACGCNRTTLNDWPKFMAARAMLKNGKQSLARGSKDSKTGDIEAWE